MKRILLVFLMLAFMNNVHAEECSEEKLEQLKEKSKNILVSTEFNTKDVYLGDYESNLINIQGLTEGFYLYSNDMSYLYSYYESNNGIIDSVVNADVKELYVYNSECPNDILRKVKLSLKKYNPYSDYQECKEIGEDKLEVCDKYYDKIISEEEFQKIIKKYKEENNKKVSVQDIKNNKLYVAIGGIVLAILIIVILIKKRKSSILD